MNTRRRNPVSLDTYALFGSSTQGRNTMQDIVLHGGCFINGNPSLSKSTLFKKLYNGSHLHLLLKRYKRVISDIFKSIFTTLAKVIRTHNGLPALDHCVDPCHISTLKDSKNT